MKEVETHTCRSCTFQMQIMRHKPMEKTSAFYLWKTKERLPLLFSWLFWFYCRLPLFSPLFFLSQWRKDQRKKNLYVPLLSVFSLPASVAFFFSFFSCFFLLFFSPFFLLFFCSPFLFFFPALPCFPDLTAMQGWGKKLPLFYAFFFLS